MNNFKEIFVAELGSQEKLDISTRTELSLRVSAVNSMACCPHFHTKPSHKFFFYIFLPPNSDVSINNMDAMLTVCNHQRYETRSTHQQSLITPKCISKEW